MGASGLYPIRTEIIVLFLRMIFGVNFAPFYVWFCPFLLGFARGFPQNSQNVLLCWIIANEFIQPYRFMNLWIVEASVCSVGLYNLVINSDLETPGQRAPAPATLNLTGLGARVSGLLPKAVRVVVYVRGSFLSVQCYKWHHHRQLRFLEYLFLICGRIFRGFAI